MRIRATGAALATATSLALSAAPVAGCTVPGDLPALRSAVLSSYNLERRHSGLPPLRPSLTLDEAAQAHACDLARRQQVSHRSGLFGTLPRRLRRAGYAYSMANENLAAGQTGAAQAMRGWMASPAHRANVLAPRARDLGVGVARAAGGRLYWVSVAAAPR